MLSACYLQAEPRKKKKQGRPKKYLSVDITGMPAGKYPLQYELDEFKKLTDRKLSFSENPDIDKLNKELNGDKSLPAVKKRLPAEPLVASGLDKGKTLDERVRETAARCKLNLEYLRRFPHAFSGGQRQRISIARAIISNPEFVDCDESVSSLDVSIQAEILNLLMDLRKELKTAYLFIAHDLSVVAQISDRVAVMYMGIFVELAPTGELFFHPRHPYTEALLSAIPRVNPDHDMKPVILKGEIPGIVKMPAGCRFHTRCIYAREQCKTEVPEWREIDKEHFVACHLADELGLAGAVAAP